MNAGVTTQPQSQPQGAQMGFLALGPAGPGEAFSTSPMVPVKRNPEDGIEFVSSHPVKKLRLRTEEDGTVQPLSQAHPKATLHNPVSIAVDLASTQAPRASAVRSSQTSLDQHVGSKPFGLASHLSSHAMWNNKGTSFRSMEHFSFQTAYPSSHRPADSAAVSPKQMPQNLSIDQEQAQIPQGTQVIPTLGLFVDQAPRLDACARPSSLGQPNYATITVNGANVYDTEKAEATKDETRNPTHAQHGQAFPTLMPVSYYAIMNHLPTSRTPTPYNPAGLNIEYSRLPQQSQVLNQPHLSGVQIGQSTTAAPPNPGPMVHAPHVFTRHLIPGHSEMTASVFGPNLPKSLPPTTVKRGPCPLCVMYGPHHGHLGIPAHQPSLNHHVGGPSSQQAQLLNARSSPPIVLDGSTPYPNPSYLLQPGLNWPVQDSVPSGKTPTAALTQRSPTVGDAIVPLPPTSYHPWATGFPNNAGNHSGPTTLPLKNLDTSERLTRPLGPPNSLQPEHQQPSDPGCNSQRQPKTFQSPLPVGSDHFALSPSPPPVSIPTATSLAASHVHTRARNQHAQNLLVDVAETATEIFPYELIARRHGCPTSKVVEALAAVVQIPLLRCATDKRRAGKLGAERIKEVKEMRKVWTVRERGQERLRKERKRRGETGNAVGSGEGNRAKETDEETVGEEVKSEESRSVFVPPAPGQPSALELAHMLGPMEMPGVLTGDGVFTGQWQ